jgi:hypothetical protein
MPIEKIIALASAIFAGIVATHPLTWRTEVRKLEYSMFKEVADTRSWGNPSIFPVGKSHIQATGRPHRIGRNSPESQP